MLDKDFYEPAGPIRKYILKLHYYDPDIGPETKKLFESNSPFPRFLVGDFVSWDPRETFISGTVEHVFLNFYDDGTTFEMDVRLR